jgi:hypothetical protein
MATIAEVRAQYPQYSDMSDADLAGALHAKFYSDMPVAEFNAKIGLTQPAPAAPAPSNEIPSPRVESPRFAAVREFVTPTMQAVGSMAGATLGAPAGPLGMVVGGGAGYAATEALLKQADVLAGNAPPMTPAQGLESGAKDVLTGMTFEAGGRAAGYYIGEAIKLGAKSAGKIYDALSGKLGELKAADILRQAFGDDVAKATVAARAADAGLSARQAVSELKAPAAQALLRRVETRTPQAAKNALTSADVQEMTRLNALADLAGGTTSTEAKAAQIEGKKALNTATTPMRETALDQANKTTRELVELESRVDSLSEAAAAKVQEVRDLVNAGKIAEASAKLNVFVKGLPPSFAKHTYQGKLAAKADDWASQAASASLNLGEGARFAQAAVDTLKSNGVAPLKSASVISKIEGLAKNPEFAGNDILEGAVKNIANDIARWTESGGVIDARALDAIRKNSIVAAVAQLRPGIDATTQRNLASSVITKIKPLIDDAIEAAGGKGYKEYLAEYSKHAQQLGQQKLAGVAQEMYKNDKKGFIKLVEGNSPDEVEKIFGPGSYDIAKEMSAKAMATFKGTASEIKRDLGIESQATLGQDALKELLESKVFGARIPPYLSKVTTSVNTALDILEKKLGKKVMDSLTTAAASGEKLAQLLQLMPTSDRNAVLKALKNPQEWLVVPKTGKGAAAAGTVNSLAPESVNELRGD